MYYLCDWALDLHTISHNCVACMSDRLQFDVVVHFLKAVCWIVYVPFRVALIVLCSCQMNWNFRNCIKNWWVSGCFVWTLALLLLLQIWALQQGPRVAAFNVSKCCQLICPVYGLMGLNNVTSATCQLLSNTVYLLDPDGSIKSVDIPFHLALRYS